MGKGKGDPDHFVFEEKKAYILGRQYAGIWETALWMCGFEKFFTDMALNKPFAHRLMEKITELKMQYWGKALDTVGENVLIVSEADDLATQQKEYFAEMGWSEDGLPATETLQRLSVCPGGGGRWVCLD